jgi:glycosyltransferase involved in cell wall biosynthesis
MTTPTDLDLTLTIITPTFNRYSTLTRLYESLEKQDILIYEWIVIDDGSTDDTAELINDFKSKSNNICNLIYIYQQNSGKHIALNNGLSRASGTFICFVDSDDWLPLNSLEALKSLIHDSNVLLRSEISAISGMKFSPTGEPISAFNSKQIEIMSHFEWFYLEKRLGDRIDFYKRSAIGDRRFNCFGNEKFLTEDVFWLSLPGLKLFTNTPMLIGEYLLDGLTAQYDSLFVKNPAGSAFYYQTLISQFDLIRPPPSIKLYALFFYYSFLSVSKKNRLRSFLALTLFPFVALYKKLM